MPWPAAVIKAVLPASLCTICHSGWKRGTAIPGIAVSAPCRDRAMKSREEVGMTQAAIMAMHARLVAFGGRFLTGWIGSEPIERRGVAAEYRRPLVCGQRRCEPLRAGVPALVVAIEVQHRPVAAPHEALRAKRREQMRDPRRKRGVVPARRGFGREPRELAVHLRKLRE